MTAIPYLFPEGPRKGHLKYVSFITTDGAETYKWSTMNIGTYVQDFAFIVDAGSAQHILDELHRGKTVMVLHKFGPAIND